MTPRTSLTSTTIGPRAKRLRDAQPDEHAAVRRAPTTMRNAVLAATTSASRTAPLEGRTRLDATSSTPGMSNRNASANTRAARKRLSTTATSNATSSTNVGSRFVARTARRRGPAPLGDVDVSSKSARESRSGAPTNASVARTDGRGAHDPGTPVMATVAVLAPQPDPALRESEVVGGLFEQLDRGEREQLHPAAADGFDRPVGRTRGTADHCDARVPRGGGDRAGRARPPAPGSGRASVPGRSFFR